MSISYNHVAIYTQILCTKGKMMRLLGIFQQAGSFSATFLSHIRWPPAYTHALVSKLVSKTDSQNLRLFTGNVKLKAEVACYPNAYATSSLEKLRG